MKNLLFVLIIIAAAIVVYQQLQPQSSDSHKTAAISAGEGQTVATDAENPIDVSALMSDAADNARVFFVEPKHESVVTSPVTVKFGIENMLIAAAGDNQPNSGHHHLLINVSDLPDMTKPLPATDQIIHFGKAQTETTIDLPPGQHTLQLVLGNYLHIPHTEPVISERITITVE